MKPAPARQSRVLISAYACNPYEGSEPQTGWAVANSLSLIGYEVVVLTRTNNREAIESSIANDRVEWPGGPPSFEYLDLPQPIQRIKQRAGLLRTYYYLWQLKAFGRGRELTRESRFDATLHITFGSCWFPSSLALLRIPFVWGPVGGGETIPLAFVGSLGWRGIIYETGRAAAKLRGRMDPLVRLTARRSRFALGTTNETVAQLRRLGCRQADLLPRMSLSSRELAELRELGSPPDNPFRFLCIGRLLDWKGFHLALKAFAAAGIPDSRLWIIGDGPAGTRLKQLAKRLGIEEQTHFLGALSRSDTLATLGAAHVLVHPSLHDSGSWVAAEAMAAGRPVICLNLGGPGVIVSDQAGYRVEPGSPRQAVRDIAAAMRELAADPNRRRAMGIAGQKRIEAQFNWEARGSLIGAVLDKATE